MNFSLILLIFAVVAVQQGIATPAVDRIASATEMAPTESSNEGTGHAHGEQDHSGHAGHNHTSMDDGFHGAHGAHGHGVQVDQKVLQHSLTDLTKEKAIDKISKL